MSARAQHVDWQPDPALAVSCGLLLLLGLVMVTSASITVASRDLGDPFYYLERQTIYAVLGIVVAAVVASIPTRLWERAGVFLLLLAMLLLVLVLIPGFGHEINGSTRWLRAGPIGVQASEPARLLIVMYLAARLVRQGDELRTRFGEFVKPVLVVVVACGLLLAEPDFGAATVLLITALGLLFVAGVKLRYFALMLAGTVVAFGALALSSAYRVKRLTAFLDPWADPFDTGFQLTQSLIAFGRGGWFGVGLGNGVQKLFYLPEAHTDFLFAVLGEELGLIGVLITLALLSAIVVRSIAIANQAAEHGLMYQAYLASGISIWLGLQALINIGVAMGMLPTKGLTLPLLSYGGSSLVVTLACVGLLLRIDREVCLASRSASPRRRRSR